MLLPNVLGPESTTVYVVLQVVSDDVRLLQEQTHTMTGVSKADIKANINVSTYTVKSVKRTTSICQKERSQKYPIQRLHEPSAMHARLANHLNSFGKITSTSLLPNKTEALTEEDHSSSSIYFKASPW